MRKYMFRFSLILCLLLCCSQITLASVVTDENETSDHTVVRIWITDGKNLPDTNENNPILSVRVVDEEGNLIPNANVTLHLVKPTLTDEIVMKSEQNGSTKPTQGTPAAPITYKVFGPGSPEIQYVARANATGYSEGVTQPFEITFDVSGTIEIKLTKRDPVHDVTVTYVVRENDKAEIAFTDAGVKKGTAIGAGNVPRVTIPNTPEEQWKFLGYYIQDKKYTAEELARYMPSQDTVVEIRSMPDQNNDGKDDRDKEDDTSDSGTGDSDNPTKGPGGDNPGNKKPSTQTEGKGSMFHAIKTGQVEYDRYYVVGFTISLLFLLWLFLSMLYRMHREKR